MTTVYNPDDTVIGPIIQALGSIVQAQITNVAIFYTSPPDAAPEDNSFMFAFTGFALNNKDTGSTYIEPVLQFKLAHFVRQSTFSDNLAFLQQLYLPYMLVFSAWYNQDLGGLSLTVTPKKGSITQVPYSDEPRVALLIDLEVVIQIQIPLS